MEEAVAGRRPNNPAAVEEAVEAASASCSDVCDDAKKAVAAVEAIRNTVRYRRCRLNLSRQYLLPARRSSAQNSARRKSPERSSLLPVFSSRSLPLPEDSSQFPYQEDRQQGDNYFLGNVKGYSD